MDDAHRAPSWFLVAIAMCAMPLVACSNSNSANVTPSNTATPSLTPSTSASPSPTITFAPPDPNYPDVPMHSEADLDASTIGEGWFLVEYSHPDATYTPTVNFLVDPQGELYRTSTYVFPADSNSELWPNSVLWLGDEYWFTRITEENEYGSPTGDIIRGYFSSGSLETISSGEPVGYLLPAANGYVLVEVGGEDNSASLVITPDGTSRFGFSRGWTISPISPDGITRVIFTNEYTPPSEVVVETMGGQRTTIAELKYRAAVYHIVGWLNDDELLFFRRSDDGRDVFSSSGPRVDFVLNVNTGDVAEVDLPISDELWIDLIGGMDLFISRHDGEAQLIRADGSILYWCTQNCSLQYSGNRGVFGSQQDRYEEDSVLTFVDLESGAVIRELEVKAGERYVFHPYGGSG